MSRVLVIGGGACQEASRQPLIVKSDMILYADVAGEVEKVTGIKNNNVVSLILGRGHTIPTLIEKVKKHFPDADKILKFYQERPAVDFSRGMGMWAILGRMALELLIKGENGQGELAKFLLEKVFNPVFKSADGVLTNLEVISMGSLSGGAGGGVNNRLPQCLFQVIKERSDAVCRMLGFRIGAITFTGLGPNIYPNAGIRLVEDLAHTLAYDRDPREMRELWCLELPPLDENKIRRDQLIAWSLQALFSKEAQDQLNIGLPNIHDPLDGVKLLKLAWWNGISSRLTAAFSYADDLHRFTDDLTPDLSVCQDIRVKDTKKGGVWSTENLKNTIKDEYELPDREKSRGNLQFWAEVWIIFKPNDEKELIEHPLYKPVRIPQDLEECKKIIEQSMGFIARTTAKLEEANKEHTNANNDLEALERELEKMIKEHDTATQVAEQKKNPKGFWAKVWAWLCKFFRSAQAEQNKIGDLYQSYLQKLEAYYRTEAIVFVLKSNRDSMQSNLDGYQDRLRRLEKKLREISGGEGAKGLTFVEFKPFTETFRDLIELSEADQAEGIKYYLDGSVKNVTLRGLAAIAGLQKEEAQVFSIASKLLHRSPPFAGPDWGGKPMLPENSQIRFLVFPPVGPSLQQEIRETMERLKADCIITFCDNSAAGNNVVSIDIHRARRLSDIVTPIYVKGLEDALQKPELYHLSDVDISGMLAELNLNVVAEKAATTEVLEVTGS